MPNKKDHLEAGGLVGAGAAFFFAREESVPAILVETLGGFLAGRECARLPDIFDPPNSGHHRSWGHGIAPCTIISAATFEKWLAGQEWLREEGARHAALAWKADNDNDRLWHFALWLLCHMGAGAAAGGPVGYVSHLILDARTSRGLPMLG